MQRGVRDFAACTTARVAVLRLLWLRCEDEHGALTKKKKKRKPRSKRKEDGEEEHYARAAASPFPPVCFCHCSA